jgi:hypothetical protein
MTNIGYSPQGLTYTGVGAISFSAPLKVLLESRLGRPVDDQWLAVVEGEAMAYVRLLAPCKREDWLQFSNLPADVQIVLASALTRIAENPQGYRQMTIGEFSYTIGGSGSARGPFSASEVQIIRALGGCSGELFSVRMETPAPLNIAAPDVTSDIDAPEDPSKPTDGYWYEEPSHANGFHGGWRIG